MAVKSSRQGLNRYQQLAKGPIDLPFLMLVLLLLGIGLIMLLSASSYAALYDRAAGYNAATGTLGDPYYYFKRQALFAVLGIVGMLLASRLDYQYLRILSVPVLLGAIVLLILVLTPLGVTQNNSTRWLRLALVAGPTYQPSEVAKLGVVLFFSARLSKRRYGPPEFARRLPQPWEKIRYFFYWSDLAELIPYGVILVVIAILMLREPHMSGTLLVLAAGAAILFAAGIRLGWFALGAGAMIGVAYAVIGVMGYNSSRIAIWLDPWSDPTDTGYQVVQSLYAVASGGLTGLGFGLSRQKYLYLPEEQNDFIFAIICEELGFIGATLIVVLFALLVIRGYWLALHARDRFGSLLIVGITTLLAVQVFLNMAVVLNLIPATGISLPFFSYGGTALLIQLVEMGIILSVSRQIAPPKQN
ncbi:MAG: putative lipid II flippase FtsW [Clostridiales bacterium]|nr:putative lipid II flippase FtsW [Clostridiales bacterium]